MAIADETAQASAQQPAVNAQTAHRRSRNPRSISSRAQACVALWAAKPDPSPAGVDASAAFLVRDSDHAAAWLRSAAWLFRFAKTLDPLRSTPLNELFISDFDHDQVWEQIRLMNEPLLEFLEQQVERRRALEADDDASVAESLDEQQEEYLETGSDIDEDSEGDDEDGMEDPENVDEDELALDEDELAMDDDEDDDDEQLEEDDDHMADEEIEMSEEEDDAPAKPVKRKRSVVDDDFFSLEEMERFADMGEKHDMRMARKGNKGDEEDEDDKDEFSAFDSDILNTDLEQGGLDDDDDEEDLEKAFGGESDNANEIFYQDFFERKQDRKQGESRRRPTWQDREMDADDAMDEDRDDQDDDQDDIEDEEDVQKGPRDLLADMDDDEDQAVGAVLSSFEKQQAKMQKTIKELETEAMQEKSWALKGEVSSKVRPVNSLLEEPLEFENTSKPVPVITEETTVTLQDLITQRIKDQAWDDVERKAPPKNTAFDPNRRIELMDEKNSKSLAEVYEEEYLRQKDKSMPTEKDTALQKQHEEITNLFQSLSHDLDALSNWHYTPKSATLELEVVPPPNLPAIQMEDVIPVAVSDATLVTPKEVYDGKTSKSQNELDAADKRRLRLKAKRQAKREHKAREQAQKQREAETGITNAQMAKQKAVKQLMGQRNVTIVASGKTAPGSSGKNGKAGKKSGASGHGAKIVRAGDKAGNNNAPKLNPSDLRL